MNTNTNPFWLADKHAPSELKNAYKEATRDKAAVQATYRITAALHILIDEAAFHSELQCAVKEVVNSGGDIVARLLARESNVLAQIEEVRAEKQLYKGFGFARHIEVLPILNQCSIESGQLSDAITALESKIYGFAKQRDIAKEKYEKAGLTESQIEQIGVLPSLENLADWKGQLAEKMARAEQIARFYRSSPDYDTSLLEVTVAVQAA